MKNLKKFLVAAAVAFSGVSHADPLVVNTNTSAAPTTLRAAGSIVKYVQFVDTRNIINMDTFGGPTHEGKWESVVNTGDTKHNAEITFDSNTHISVTIVNGTRFGSSSEGIHQDTLMPTEFRIGVKGNDVRKGDGTRVASSNVAYADQGYTNASQNRIKTISSTYIFANGKGNGISVNARAERKGLTDHTGQYVTGSTSITWADLN